MAKKDILLYVGVALIIISIVFSVAQFVIAEHDPTTGEAEQESDMLIGGQTDEHGCLIPAGYSWDEQKQACIRPWSGEVQ